MLTYKSWLYRTLETLVFFVPSLVFNIPVQKQLISVELCDNYLSDPVGASFNTPLILSCTSRKLATLVFGLNSDWPAHACGPARAYWPALCAGQARAARGPITPLSANKPSDFYNIDCAYSFL